MQRPNSRTCVVRTAVGPYRIPSDNPRPSLPVTAATPLTSIVYISAARALLTGEEIQEILRQSRQNNATRDVTGLLLYWDGNFLQYIEGPADSVDGLLETIRRDSRHSGLTVLDRGVIAARAFPDWRMGYERVRSPVATMRGVSDYLADGDLPSQSAAMAPHVRRLIEIFREHLR